MENRSSGTENRSTNRTRGAWLYRTSYLLIVALGALAVGRASIFGFSDEKPQRVVFSGQKSSIKVELVQP